MPDKKEEEQKDATTKGEEKEEESMEIEIPAAKPTPEIKEQVDQIVAETLSAGPSALAGGLEKLLFVEKKQRQAEHEANTSFCVESLLRMLHQNGDWKLLAEQISVVCKRRSQFTNAVKRAVKISMEWLDGLKDDKENHDTLLTALLGVTEGKIYVEVERARLTMRKSMGKEEEGDVAEASKILQELQIETFGSMVKKEKCEFLLEQMRLCLLNMDFIRCGLVRNKITTKAIREFPVLERKYWQLSLRLFYNKGKQYLEMARGYRRMLDLYGEGEREQKLTMLANAVYTVILAERDPEQQTLLHTMNNSPPSEEIGKLLESLARLRHLLKVFCTAELIIPNSAVFEPLQQFCLEGIDDPEQCAKHTKLLRQRVLQHNIRVMAGYYTQCRSDRLAELIGCDISRMEEELSAMVTDGVMYARIDRVDGIVTFAKKEAPATVLNNWRRDIDKLLGLVNTMCHQIHKESMEVKA